MKNKCIKCGIYFKKLNKHMLNYHGIKPKFEQSESYTAEGMITTESSTT